MSQEWLSLRVWSAVPTLAYDYNGHAASSKACAFANCNYFAILKIQARPIGDQASLVEVR
jgi:hypothetical protein